MIWVPVLITQFLSRSYICASYGCGCWPGISVPKDFVSLEIEALSLSRSQCWGCCVLASLQDGHSLPDWWVIESQTQLLNPQFDSSPDLPSSSMRSDRLHYTSSPLSALPPTLSISVAGITLFPFSQSRNAEVLLTVGITSPPNTAHHPGLVIPPPVVLRATPLSPAPRPASWPKPPSFTPTTGLCVSILALFQSIFHIAARAFISKSKLNCVSPTPCVLQFLPFVSAFVHPLGLRLNATSSGHFCLINFIAFRFNLHNVYQNWDVCVVCATTYLPPALPGKLDSIEHGRCV